jgi:phosphoglycolate phosphatase-like HAD superfamily hydrolase
MTEKRIVIFDIDGTLADASHRTHLVREKPKNWPRFFDLMVHDPVHEHVATFLRMLVDFPDKYEIILVSGRGEEYRKETEGWLEKHGLTYRALYMRPAKDSRGDDIVKEEIYKRELEPHKNRILCVFDDRPRVIRMWRKHGIKVLDCGDGIEF